ncbi:MAG TPA: aminodeoxychorismate/anthranilate synthase component II [Paucimonas sp.]|nr:aminodeoxychorismate/anthranilate synthase component II [Paucimonas sp.]
MLCVIDNYDSFTYNIVHYLHELDVDVRVILNDKMSVAEVLALKPDHILLSPGPGVPDESGISKELLLAASAKGIPVLGVCLGHEIIGEVFGGRVKHARQVMHGKASRIHHDGSDVFSNVPNAFSAARYHSLVIEKESFPDCLKITAWTAGQDDAPDEIMGVAHKTLPIFGVQFHPESIMTEHGHRIFANFLGIEPKRHDVM